MVYLWVCPFLLLSLLPLSSQTARGGTYKRACSEEGRRWPWLTFIFTCSDKQTKVAGCVTERIRSDSGIQMDCLPPSAPQHGYQLAPAQCGDASCEQAVSVVTTNLLLCTPKEYSAHQAATWTWPLRYRNSTLRGSHSFLAQCILTAETVQTKLVGCVDGEGGRHSDKDEWISGDDGRGHGFVRGCSVSSDSSLAMSAILTCYDKRTTERKQHLQHWLSRDKKHVFQCIVPVPTPTFHRQGLARIREIHLGLNPDEIISDKMDIIYDTSNGENTAVSCITWNGTRAEPGDTWNDQLRYLECVRDDEMGLKVKTVACRNDLDKARQEDGSEWVVGRFVYRCSLSNEIPGIEAVGCLDNQGKKVAMDTEWVSTYHQTVFKCVRNESFPISAWMVNTACLDPRGRRVYNGEEYKTSTAVFRCRINKDGSGRREGVACIGQNGMRINNGTLLTKAGFVIHCMVREERGHVKIVRGINCTEPGVTASVNREIELGCLQEKIAIETGTLQSPIVVHPRVRGCIKKDGSRAFNNSVFFEVNRQGVSIMKRCFVLEYYDANTGEYQFFGGISALKCKLKKETLEVGCFSRIVNKSVAYCRLSVGGEVGEAEIGTLPFSTSNTNFLISSFGLRSCGDGLPWRPQDIPQTPSEFTNVGASTGGNGQPPPFTLSTCRLLMTFTFLLLLYFPHWAFPS